ncbi:glycerol-3-phosphate dehydrogenase/oxidase, partial [Alicyclobacillaceae bacterium I2511]
AGILLDAHTRGMKVGLVEMQDFAAGTSSRSTKLVHGGLRYLKQFDVSLVAEVGKERAIVYENGPHVTTPLWMLLPIVQSGTYGMFMSSVGIYVYDRLAQVKESERRQMLTVAQALEKEPLLRQEGLRGAGFYVEYQTDDARLTLEIVKEAVERGAMAFNYAKAERLLYDKSGRVNGAQIKDLVTGETYAVYAHKVLNATGPWVDELRELDHSKRGKTMHLTKGVHIVVDKARFPLRNPVYFDVPDGRMVFAIPRDGKTYVGTTDTDYDGNPGTPRTSAVDRDYLIGCINYMFPSVALRAQDVESVWAGVRPLIHEEGKAPSEISRKDEVFISPSGLITIAGGKLTGYRKMADKVVSLVAEELSSPTHREILPCTTDKIALSGGKFGGSEQMPAYLLQQIALGVELGLTESQATQLAHRYGTNIAQVYDAIRKAGDTMAQFGLPLDVFGTLLYGIQHEMVVTPADYFVRRTAAMFFDIHWVRKWKEPVIRFMAETLHWSQVEEQRNRAELERDIVEATEVL